MPTRANASADKTGKEKFIKARPIDPTVLKRATADFVRNFKPLFEEMEAWREESASSQTRVF